MSESFIASVTVSDVLRDTERFQSVLPGFRPRDAQLQMATAIEDCIDKRATLVVEAETGTGKTLAYLIPALLSEGPVLVSTGTKGLQDQLFFKDLPNVQKALGIQRSVALLKGRANYLCPYRLQMHLEDVRFYSREALKDLRAVEKWAGQTPSGDLGELKKIPEDSPVWPWVSSTAENCLGQDCPYHRECPVMEARKQAQEADLVVVNHHLFFADAALREEGVSELLPGANTIIFDEAHQLPDIAATFFGESLSGRQIAEVCRDSLAESADAQQDTTELLQAIEATEKALADFRLSMGGEGQKAAWSELSSDEVDQKAADLVDTLCQLEHCLEPLELDSRGLESCYRRAGMLAVRLRRLSCQEDSDQIHWYETYKRSFVLHGTPMSVAEPFQACRQRHPGSWILTSATLSIAGDFSHFQQRLGLEDSSTLHLSSPFDFRMQSVFYLPEGLPEVRDSGYGRALVEKMIPVIEAAGGRTFFLFTSHRALREAADLLENRLDYPLLVQGTRSRRELLDEFRRLGNAVLLGTGSFWEGIDVRGEALSCVIIDKLPFASPGEPVVAARIERLREEGGNPFFDYQLPHAVISLRQGAGRLIRDVTDRGVLVLGDNRLVTKGYGRLFLDSLPGMTKTRKQEVVERFFSLEPTVPVTAE